MLCESQKTRKINLPKENYIHSFHTETSLIERKKKVVWLS